MDKVIGIPKGLFSYYYINNWKKFFDRLNIKYIISPNTNKEIIKNGSKLANSEMCLSLKIFLGHVDYLKDKCDYILIPRIDNYGICEQTCTNFLSVYDLVNNLFDVEILNYDLSLTNNKTELKGLIEIGKKFNCRKKDIINIYKDIIEENEVERQEFINENIDKLDSHKIKILLVGHPYNLYDYYIGIPLIKMLKSFDVEIIYSDLFDSSIASSMSQNISSTLYWKYNKEIIGSIPLVENKIDGIIFISSFPCGPDSLVNTLAIKNINIPNINIIIDDSDSNVGYETRIESFIDILESRRKNG